MAYSNSKKQEFIELRAKGLSYQAITKQITVSKPTLIEWSYDLQNDIANYRAIEQEALRDEYLASKKHRIIFQGKQLKAILKELEKRDLSEISTVKLVDIAIKLSDSLATDEPQLVFNGEGLQSWGNTRQWAG